MNDTSDNQPQDQNPSEPDNLPLQSSPSDTGNWDNRPFTTPAGRIVINTFLKNVHDDVAN